MTQRKATSQNQQTVTGEPLGRLIRYSIDDLFGHRKISFELTNVGPTVLTGANGSGKSTILRTIDAISTGSWSRLAEIPFSKLTLSFDSDVQLIVTKEDQRIIIKRSDQDAPWSWSPQHLWWITPGSYESTANLNRNVLFSSPNIIAASTGKSFSTGDIFLTQGEVNTTYLSQIGEPQQGSGHWVNRLASDFPVLFITDDRLVVSARSRGDSGGQAESEVLPTSAAVDQAIQNISEVHRQALAEYARSAQSIDRDFLSRVVSSMEEGSEPSERELNALLAQVSIRRDALLNVGLLPANEPPLEKLRLTATNAKTVVRVFAEDTLRKFDSLEPMRTRLEVLLDFINRHYRGKQLNIDSTKGAVIIERESSDNRFLRPTSLSSGEQQILVLAHQVLFLAHRGTLVLIDEPELSLHVLWQDQLISDITRMGHVNNLSFLLATHSPILIAGREDLRRSLDPS